MDYDETREGLRLQMESCVKEAAGDLINNGSSPGTWRFRHDGFKMVKVIFAKV